MERKIDNVLIPADIKLTPKKITIEGSPIVALEGKSASGTCNFLGRSTLSSGGSDRENGGYSFDSLLCLGK